MLNLSSTDSLNFFFELCAYIFNSISLFSSLCIIIKIYSNKNQHVQISNQFILHITFSEMLNSITILSSILMHIIGTKEEKYTERMRVCYTQIFTGLFANFYTLSSSFLIAFRIYDLLLNNSLIFKETNNVRIAKLVLFYGSLLISYIFWVIQLNLQNYEQTSTKLLKVLSCWVSDYPDLIVIVIYIVLLTVICYFCAKGSCFITRYANTINQDNTNETETEEIEKVKAIQRRLIFFPISCIIIFALIIAHRFIVRVAKGDEFLTTITFILYTIPTSLRGFIFAIVYFGALQRIKQSFVDIFCCKICKKKKIPTLNSFFILEDMNEDKSIDEIEDE